MAKPPGKCIFCGQRGLTKEHIWADWLEPYLPREMKEHISSLQIYSPDKVLSTLKKRSGDPYVIKPKVVCFPCNNGWMSDIQQVAKPILLPLIVGEDAVLTKKHQAIIASWAAMAIMTAEYLNRELIAIAAEDRAHLYNFRKLPNNWRVWVGNYKRERWIGRYVHSSFPVIDENSPEISGGSLTKPNTQTTVFVVGRLFFFAMSSQVVDISQWLDVAIRLPSKLVCIWPPSGAIAWPPPATLSDRDADNLSELLMDLAAATDQ
jgi:hypothetical protein